MISADSLPAVRPLSSFKAGRIGAWLVLGLMLLLSVLPLGVMLHTAFQHPSALMDGAAQGWQPTLLNLQRVVGLLSEDESRALGGSGAQTDFGAALLRSLLFTALVAGMQTPVAPWLPMLLRGCVFLAASGCSALLWGP